MTDVPIDIETTNRIKNYNENDVLRDDKNRTTSIRWCWVSS